VEANAVRSTFAPIWTKRPAPAAPPGDGVLFDGNGCSAPELLEMDRLEDVARGERANDRARPPPPPVGQQKQNASETPIRTPAPAGVPHPQKSRGLIHVPRRSEPARNPTAFRVISTLRPDYRWKLRPGPPRRMEPEMAARMISPRTSSTTAPRG